MSNTYPNVASEGLPEHFYGSLESFTGTGLAPLISESLAAAGINPATYNPIDYDHQNYFGFPVSEFINRNGGDLSPVMYAVGAKMEQGDITVDTSVRGKVKLKQSPPIGDGANTPNLARDSGYRLSKLSSHLIEGLVDAKTGDVVAYAVPLDGDGSHSGHALISTRDVEPVIPATD